MITMNELVDLRMQQHIAHEIYRQQIMQRIPDPFPLLPMPIPRHIMLPPRVTLPGVDATLQNLDLWKQFHQIGTEMIITKSGRRMFPSMRLSLSGLEDDVNYCVLLEMVPIGDCRFKFSGSQWVPAGGAEPQSPQRMYLHPDSPATGSHWQAQPILFNKVKLTNNTLDSNGHVVLTSMHKYQPRIHIIRTSDPTQIPWAPQQPFIFPETEFVAVTAYQNDRITKLKIDNNPFAKGFRETGQSRCKRKMASSPSLDNNNHQHQTSSLSSSSSSSTTEISPIKSNDHFNVVNDHENRSDDNDSPLIKRMRSNSSACSTSSSLDDRDDRAQSFSSLISCSSSSGTSSPSTITADNHFRGHYSSSQHQHHQHPHHHHHQQQQQLINQHQLQQQQQQQQLQHHHHHQQHHYPSIRNNELLMQHLQKNMQNLINPSLMDLACSYFGRNTTQSAQTQSVLSNAGLGYSQSLIQTSPTIHQTTSLPISVTVGGNANSNNNNNMNDINPSQFYSSSQSSSSSSSSSTTLNHLVHSPSNLNGLSPLSTTSSSAPAVSSTSPSVISVSLVSTAIGERNLPGYYSPPINVDENLDDNDNDDDDDNDNEQNERNLILDSNRTRNLNGNVSPVFSDTVNIINSSSSTLVNSSSATSQLKNSSDKLNDEINCDEDFVVKLPSKRNNFTISAILGGDN